MSMDAESVCVRIFDDDSDVEFFFDGSDEEFNDTSLAICEEVTVGDV